MNKPLPQSIRLVTYLKLLLLLYSIHQIAAIDVLHYEIEAIHCLKTRMQLHKKWWLLTESQHFLLDHDTVDVVVLDNDVLFQDLDGVQLFRVLAVGEEHFAKAALAEHHQQIEVGELDRVRVVGSGGLGSVAFAIG